MIPALARCNGDHATTRDTTKEAAIAAEVSLFTDIPQVAAGFSFRLRHIGLSRNPEAPMRLDDGRRAGPTPSSESGRVEFSLIETQLSCELERTHDNRTLYAVDRSDGGRNSAISRRMSANRFLEMATSAI
jgi:hypothetical protein